MADRRRANAPPGGTAAPVYASSLTGKAILSARGTRAPSEIRNIFLKIGLTPSASGSAYLEHESSSDQSKSLASSVPSLKLSCTVHGPRPLPRSAPFSPQLLLSTRIKFAPFASRSRRGYVPDASERDLAAHLETALRGVLIGERWPKSGVEIVITVLEGEEDSGENGQTSGWAMMSILSGCITVASAALVDAGIDCVGLVTGGVAAIVRQPFGLTKLVMDPCPSDHEDIVAACVVGYLQSSDEVTEMWTKGHIARASSGKETSDLGFNSLVDHAVEAAIAARRVLVVNWNAVGTELNLKPATAAMRLTSLTKAIEATQSTNAADSPSDQAPTQAVEGAKAKKSTAGKAGAEVGSKKRKNEDKATSSKKKMKTNDEAAEEVAENVAEKDIKVEEDAEEESAGF
ncbi:hypothetical protein P7C71_g2831, partial [Lecanoromycetidae sp. Uapishka_2]